MPLGAARITLLAFQPTVAAEAEVIRKKQSVIGFADAQIDTAQSYFGGASAVFDGTGDKIETGDTSIMSDIDTGDFTFECFFRINSASANAMIMNNMIGGGGGTGEWFVQYDPSNGLTLQLGGTPGFGYDNTITTGTWYHIAFIRTGTTCRFFIDGTQQGVDRTVSDALQVAVFRLGSGDGIQPFNGHIDEVRVSNTARYTTTFTPPTEPFVNDENTLLLIHMDGTDGSTLFEDDNGVRLPSRIEVGNNTQIDTSTSQFGGGSAIFDGTNDALRVYVDQNRVPTVGVNRYAGAFTLEFWFYMPNNPGATAVIPCANRLGGGFGVREFMILVENLNIRIAYNAYNGSDPIQNLNMNGSGAFATSTWHHLAWAYDGVDEYSVWLNGTRFNNVTTTYSNHELGINAIQLGGYGSVTNPGNDFPGSIDEFRVSGVDRYGVTNSSITVPTEPFVNDDDTWFLLHMDGTDGSQDFQDDNGVRAKQGLRAINNAQIDTSTSQFGGSSLQVDGVDDALETTFVDTFDGTGNFTIELWAKGAGFNARGKIFATYPHHSSLANSIFIDINGGTVIRCFINGADRAGGASWNSSTWNHVALQRTGELFEMFVNGTRVVNYSGGTPKDYSMDSSGGFHLGGTYSTPGVYNDEFIGHFDEVRVSEVARYASGASITLPTAPFQNDDNTVLLLHMDGTDGSTTFNDDNGVTPNHNYGA